MKIVDIFESISGEVGIDILQGELCTFVRFFGCPVGCVYCDTKETWSPETIYTEISVKELAEHVIRIGNPKIIVTGGEPFMQPDLEEFLITLSKNPTVQKIVIETAGVGGNFETHNVGHKVSYAVDFKLPSAESTYVNLNTFPYLTLGASDLIKFLIETPEDLREAIETCVEFDAAFRNRWQKPAYVFSPMNNQKADVILSSMKEANVTGIINVQIHKVLNIA